MKAQVLQVQSSSSGSSKPRSSNLRSSLISLSFSIVGLIIALLIIEVGFRVFYRFIQTPAKTWIDRPQSYLMPEDSKSLQDRSYSAHKAANTYRIAVVGDSFSFGPYLQYDDTFPKRLERWLNLNKKQPKVEVINYGVPRYSTTHEIDVVKQAIAEEADLILLQITLNDPEIKPYRPTGLLEDQKTGLLDLSNSWVRHFRSLEFVITRIFNWNSARSYRNYFYDLFSSKNSFGRFTGALRQIKDLSAESKTELAAVVFPLFGSKVDDNYPFFKLHRIMKKTLKKMPIKALDITEQYRDIPIERLQVLPGLDRHPNEIGHRIAAEAILKWLQLEQLIPREIFPSAQYPSRIGISK